MKIHIHLLKSFLKLWCIWHKIPLYESNIHFEREVRQHRKQHMIESINHSPSRILALLFINTKINIFHYFWLLNDTRSDNRKHISFSWRQEIYCFRKFINLQKIKGDSQQCLKIYSSHSISTLTVPQ